VSLKKLPGLAALARGKCKIKKPHHVTKFCYVTTKEEARNSYVTKITT
jgi:hypothetical protein